VTTSASDSPMHAYNEILFCYLRPIHASTDKNDVQAWRHKQDSLRRPSA